MSDSRSRCLRIGVDGVAAAVVRSASGCGDVGCGVVGDV